MRYMSRPYAGLFTKCSQYGIRFWYTRRVDMLKPPRPCLICGQPATRAGRCDRHYRQSETRRGTSTQRGYGSRHRAMFRANVLYACPVCAVCGVAASTVADHYPRTRRQLQRLGLDPDNPAYGRGLCESCHNAHTRRSQAHGYRHPTE